MRLSVNIATDPHTGGFATEYETLEDARAGLDQYLTELTIWEANRIQRAKQEADSARSEH